MADTIQCYCGAVFKAGAAFSKDGSFVLDRPCPQCHRTDAAATWRGQLVQKVVADTRRLEDERKAAAYAAVKKEYDDWLAAHYKRMGFDQTWHPSYNVGVHGPRVLEWFPDIDGHDFCWLCNKIGSAYQDVDDLCTDNFRLSRDYQSDAYEDARAQGCCGFYDQEVRNPRTGAVFWIGFNYGH